MKVKQSKRGFIEKKLIISEAKNLAWSLLEKQRKNNNTENLITNNETWIRFCKAKNLRPQSHTRFIELCEVNKLIESKLTKIQEFQKAWRSFVLEVYAVFRIPQIVEWLSKKMTR